MASRNIGGNRGGARGVQRQAERQGKLSGICRFDDSASRQHQGGARFVENRRGGRRAGRYDQAWGGEDGKHSHKSAQIKVSKAIVLVDGSNVAHSTEGEK